MQVAREIANKTKIAKSLDESLSHVREMEEITQQWQLEVSVINKFIRGASSFQGCSAAGEGGSAGEGEAPGSTDERTQQI